MHALGQLIVGVMAAQDWNQSDVSRRSGMNRSRISQLIRDPVRAVPSKETIVKLARGLGLPPWVVMDAVLESAGFPTRPTHIGIEEAVAADPSLDSTTKRAVLAFVDQLRRPAPDLTTAQGRRLAEDEPVVRDRTDAQRNGSAP